MNMMDQRRTGAYAQAAEYDAGLRAYMLQVYNYMASALALTGIVAWLASSSAAIMGLLYTQTERGMSPSLLGWLVALAPIGFALFFGMRLHAMSFRTAQALYWTFAVLMGLSLSSIFLVYTGASIARVFFITAIMFGGMSLYGYTTKRDLTGMGSFLIMGVLGLFAASIVNIFLASSALHFAISVIGVLVFTGLTAYDTQKIKLIYSEVRGMGEVTGKAAIMAALNLYMDFINLFIMLLRLLGDRR